MLLNKKGSTKPVYHLNFLECDHWRVWCGSSCRLSSAYSSAFTKVTSTRFRISACKQERIHNCSCESKRHRNSPFLINSLFTKPETAHKAKKVPRWRRVHFHFLTLLWVRRLECPSGISSLLSHTDKKPLPGLINLCLDKIAHEVPYCSTCTVTHWRCVAFHGLCNDLANYFTSARYVAFLPWPQNFEKKKVLC